jgi:predicted nucleic-acid-binding Zn-ribbon protein
MEESTFQCVKCGGTMKKGFAADKSAAYTFTLKWADGEPTQANLFGITGSNVNIGNTQLRVVYGLRCERCGYLELYAV